VSSTLSVMLVATSLAAIVIVIVTTAIVVVAVLGLFVWGAIQDGREEKTRKATRKRRTPP
jgi:phosphotransferase system  glucose/maltose/N-acetylglucosamine-specific IIC component